MLGTPGWRTAQMCVMVGEISIRSNLARRGGSRTALICNRTRSRALLEAPLQFLPQPVRCLAGRVAQGGVAATQEGFTTEAQRSRSTHGDRNCGSTCRATVIPTSLGKSIFLRD